MKKQGNIVVEKDGIKVGDRVKYEKDGETYYGYVAVINPEDTWETKYLLRLDGNNIWFHNGDTCWYNWCQDWYPDNEKKELENCYWVSKEEFEVLPSSQTAMEVLKSSDFTYNWTGAFGWSNGNITVEYPSLQDAINIAQHYGIGTSKKTTMSKIKQAFQSKETKAMEHFGYGTTEELTESGREAFIDFLYASNKELRKEFLSKVVELYKEEK